MTHEWKGLSAILDEERKHAGLAGSTGITAWFKEHAAAVSAMARVRVAALKEAALVAENACLVPPDGGSPTEDERLVCEEAARRIRALLEKAT